MSEKPATPVLDRRDAPSECDGRLVTHSNQIGQFLDWLSDQGIVLAKRGATLDLPKFATPFSDEIVGWDTVEDEDVLVPISEGPSALLHRYFDIDPDEEEAELRALLGWIREQNQ